MDLSVSGTFLLNSKMIPSEIGLSILAQKLCL